MLHQILYLTGRSSHEQNVMDLLLESVCEASRKKKKKARQTKHKLKMTEKRKKKQNTLDYCGK